MPYITRNHPKLTQEGANAVLAAAQQRAREIGIAMNIAIADEGGHMMVFSRMDGARISSVRIAIAKARAAAIQRRATGPADGDPSKVMMSLAIAITSLGIQTPMRGGRRLRSKVNASAALASATVRRTRTSTWLEPVPLRWLPSSARQEREWSCGDCIARRTN